MFEDFLEINSSQKKHKEINMYPNIPQEQPVKKEIQRGNMFSDLIQDNNLDKVTHDTKKSEPVPLGFDPKTFMNIPQKQEDQMFSDLKEDDSLTRVLKHTGGLVLRALEPLDRPRSALVAGVKALKGDGEGKDVMRALKGEIHPSWGDVLPEWKPEERYKEIDSPLAPLLQEMEDRRTARSNFVRGFGSDMLMDPLNLVTLGGLSTAGESGKLLRNIAMEHGDDLVKTFNFSGVSDVVDAIKKGSPEVIGYLTEKGISPEVLSQAQKAGTMLGDTLTEQATRGQWKLGSLGIGEHQLSTPKKVNVPAAKALEKGYKGLSNTSVGRAFLTKTGDVPFDESVEKAKTHITKAQNDLLDELDILGDQLAKLPEDARLEQRLLAVNDMNDGASIEKVIDKLYDPSKKGKATGRLSLLGEKAKKSFSDVAKDIPESLTDKGAIVDLLDILDPDDTSGNAAIIHTYERGIGSAFPEVRMLQTKIKDMIDRQALRMEGAGLPLKRISSSEYFPHVGLEDEEKILSATNKIIEERRLQRVSQGLPAIPEPTSGARAIPVGKEVPQAAKAGVEEVSDGFMDVLHNIFGKLDKTTPHTLHRDLKWIVDPDTGEEIIDSVPRFAATRGVLPTSLKSRQATVKEINKFLDKDLFENDPIQALTVAQLRNEKAINGTRILGWAIDQAADDLVANAGKNIPTLADIDTAKIGMEVFLPGPQRSIRRFGKVHSVNKEEGLIKVCVSRNGEIVDFIDLPPTQLVPLDKLKRVRGNKERWRFPVLEIPEGFISSDGSTAQAVEQLAKLREMPMPANKARAIERIWQSYVMPQKAYGRLEKLFRGYTSLWKRYTLFPFMEYHVRNIVGDLWNGWINGWDARSMTDDLVNASLLQAKKPGNIKTKVYGSLDGKNIVKEAMDREVIGSGQYGEVVKDFLSPIDNPGPKAKTALQKLKKGTKEHLIDLKVPMAIGEYLEDNRRLGLFIHRLGKGDTFDQAARTVKKSLFDYSDLTLFEKGIRTYAIPFYSWFRKNLPYQFEMMIRHPGKFASLPKAKGYIEGHSGATIDEQDRPEWMRDGFSMHVGEDKKGDEQFALLQNWIPSVDLLSANPTLSSIAKALGSSLTPLAKVPLEQGTNQDWYFGNPIDFLSDGKSYLSGNERTNYLGKSMGTRTRKWMELLPFTRLLSTMDRLNPMGIFDAEDYKPLAPGDKIKTRPWHTEMDSLAKVAKAITGLKIYPVDMDRQIMYDMIDATRSGKKAGLTVGNVKTMLRRAAREGDNNTIERYIKLLEEIQKDNEEKMKRYQRYRAERSQKSSVQ